MVCLFCGDAPVRRTRYAPLHTGSCICNVSWEHLNSKEDFACGFDVVTLLAMGGESAPACSAEQ